jgi:hypothetical protein
VEQEAARDLVRAREDCRADLMSARHRVSKLLLRQGIVLSRARTRRGDTQACAHRSCGWLIFVDEFAEYGSSVRRRGQIDALSLAARC